MAAAAVAYGRTFSVPLLLDDNPSILNNATIRNLGTAFFPPPGTTVGGRPVLNLSLALNYSMGGTDVWGYHAVNLAIHALAGLALFGAVRRTLSRRRAPSADLIAFSTALLWILHPLQTESVTYLSQRAESLMGLLYLLTLYCFIRGAGAAGPGGRPWSALCVAACLLGMATKEVMVSAPLVVLLYDRTFLAGSFREAWSRRWRVHSGLAATWLILPVLVLSTHGRGGTAGFGSGVPWPSYALNQLPAIVHYLGLCFWPHPLVFDYGSVLSPPTLRVVPYALAIAGLLALTAWGLLRRPVLGFLGACFFLILAPSSSIIPVATEKMAEHRMYLPLIPVVLLVVVGIRRQLGRFALPCYLALAAGLFLATWQRNEVYRSEEGLWSDTVARCPDSERAHNNLGNVLREKPGMADAAITQYEAALRLKPDYAEAHNNLGCVLETIPGDLDEARKHYEEALRLEPGYADAHYNLGNALDSLGRTPEAISQYGEAIRLRPDFVAARCNLGSALSSSGRNQEAVAQYEEALRLKPDDPVILYNLALELLRAPGRTGEAAALMRELVRLQPGNEAARQALARIESSQR